MKRRLALKSEHLSELTSSEMSIVNGAGSLTGVYPTVDRECPTLNGCIQVGALPTTNCFTGTTGYTALCTTGC